ncbi:MAG: hypothetical protein ACR2N3_00305, partial [Pyrinomonadaceae bacterium]
FVDVSLEKENLKIAAEVSVTSTPDYETRNILKCLAAGYDFVLVVVSSQKKIAGFIYGRRIKTFYSVRQ